MAKRKQNNNTEPEAVEQAAPVRRFTVGLPGHPLHTVDAADEAAAVAAYNQWAGIISTIQQYTVTPAE